MMPAKEKNKKLLDINKNIKELKIATVNIQKFIPQQYSTGMSQTVQILCLF